MCRRAEKIGISFLSVHGRTKDQRCEPVDVDAIRIIKDAISIPVIANGDIKCLDDAEKVQRLTGVDGKSLVLLSPLKLARLEAYS